jgi:hypothetical protein
MAIELNPDAVQFARQLIQQGKFRNDSGQWHEHNPDADKENQYLAKHEMADYAKWHLGIDPSKGENTKGRYRFPYGDFKEVHRDGLLAAKERAAQQGYRDIEQAADELEQALEKQANQ